MQRSLWQALQDIRSGTLKSVYILYAVSDPFVPQWIASSIRDAHGRGTAIENRALSSGGIANLVSECYQGNLFGEDIIRVASSFEELTASHKLDENEKSALETLLQDPPPPACVLWTSAAKLDERKKITKQCMDHAQVCVIATDKHGRDEWRSLVSAVFGENSLLTAGQMEKVSERAGQSLGRIAQEAEKIALFAHGRTSIAAQEFEDLIVSEDAADVFDIVRLTVTKRYGEAYASYLRHKEQDSVFALVTLLARQYRLVAAIKEESEKGSSDAQLASMLGVHPYACKVAREQGRTVSTAECKGRLRELSALEFSIKSGARSEKTALDVWYLKCMSESTTTR